MNVLARVSNSSAIKSGDVVGAIAAFEELLVDQLSVLSPDHPDVLRTRNNMASLRAESGDIANAIVASEELLVDQLRVLSSSSTGPEPRCGH